MGGGVGFTHFPTFPFMFIFEFNHRLRKLNPELYLGDKATPMTAEWSSVGLYRRRPPTTEKISKALLNSASDEERKYIQRSEEGDEFICGVTVNWVPEYPKFDPTGRLVARGYRSILLELITRKLVDARRAKALFNCNSLGETTYDRMSFHQKRFLMEQG